MPFRKPCHMPFRKLIPPFTLTAEFQVGVLAPEDFSMSNLPPRGLTIRRSCVCCSFFMKNGLRFTVHVKHCFADDEKTALHEYFSLWWNSKSLSVECCLETKMRRDVQLLYDVMADTIGYIQIKMRAASMGGGGGGGKRRGLGPRNDVLTTCKAVTPRGGQRKIAVLFPRSEPAEEIRNAY